jgi:glycine dehydrogenase subunit 1
MDVANASMYDGSTGLAEAALMAARLTSKGGLLVARSVHPEYQEVLQTYAKNQGMPITAFDYDAETGAADLDDLERKLNDLTAAVILQSPNFFGVVEDVKGAAEIAHRRGALLVMGFTEAVSLGILEPPAADIVAGELQSFAISPSYGGPYAGIIATREKFARQMPGRLVGETTDTHGNRAFCLTLATREQHIRREKATSNICTNQALVALMVNIFMTVYGKVGLKELAKQNLAKAAYAAGQLVERGKVIFSGAPRFNEFVLQTNEDPPEINRRLLQHKIVGGLPLKKFYPELGNAALWCCTELSTRTAIDEAVKLVGEIGSPKLEKDKRKAGEETAIEEAVR